MENILNEVVSSEDLKKFEKIYNEQLTTSQVTQKAQFEYAWCLVRSRYPADVRKGIVLLEDLGSTWNGSSWWSNCWTSKYSWSWYRNGKEILAK
ncbi:Similar to Fis1: Mitochondrial fission 1 protein (Drosophila melanogaster) [Cotesia congregata]|uniref:Similar to Fis1: Mitochondrial fission 1 protein (Drosophila melanogaster) n=1 Tax=Cotesia congregata TaxID=51543 RepID=A0A8J2HAJ5_COTCN|nr:Similar to Fis1: Mitochondrial fission 1 protein (Drosophila melanogaster) [Cotesia congregata]